MEENGGKVPQVNGFSLFSCALTSYFGPLKELPDFSLLFPLKHNTIMFFDIDRALSRKVQAKAQMRTKPPDSGYA